MRRRPLLERIKRLGKVVYLKLFRINDSSFKIAIGFGLGVFVGVMPGAGPLIALLLAFLFRVNRASALLGSILFNTWVGFAAFLPAIRIGAGVTGLNYADVYAGWNSLLKNFRWEKLFELSVYEVLGPMALGYLIIAFVLAAAATTVVYLIALRIKSKKPNKKLLAGIIAAFLLLGFFTFAQAEPARELTVLFTHDLHSNLDEYARLSSAIKKERAEREGDILLVDAGDFSMGTVFHTIRSARSPELVTMGRMGYDVTTLGNHEFDFGPLPLAQSLLAAKRNSRGRMLPALIASNTAIDPGSAEGAPLRKAFAAYPVSDYFLVKRAGLKIGVFALLGQDAAFYAPEAKPVVFSGRTEAARQAVDILRKKEEVDLVVCLSHSGTWQDKSISEDELLARDAEGIDLIISGHTHTVLDPYIKVGKTYIVSSGAYGRYLGSLTLFRNVDGSFGARDYRIIPITAALPEDPEIALLVKSYEKDIEKRYLRQYGYRYGHALAEAPFFLAGPEGDKISSGLGDLVTDAFLYAARKAEGKNYRHISLALLGLGQLRAPLDKGLITVNDAVRLVGLGMGLDGRAGAGLVAFWLSGSEIRKILEYDTRLQFSGVRFSYDLAAEPFARVRQAEIQAADDRWEALDEARLYRVCTDWKALLMRSNLEQASAGKISFTPKDDMGKAIVDLQTTRIFFRKPLELKSWLAVAMYLGSFPSDGKGLPLIPEQYRRAKEAMRK